MTRSRKGNETVTCTRRSTTFLVGRDRRARRVQRTEASRQLRDTTAYEMAYVTAAELDECADSDAALVSVRIFLRMASVLA